MHCPLPSSDVSAPLPPGTQVSASWALQMEPRCGLATGEHAHKHEGEQQLSSATTVSAEPYPLRAAGSKDPRGAREFQNAQSLRKQRFSLSISCPSGPADQGAL